MVKDENEWTSQKGIISQEGHKEDEDVKSTSDHEVCHTY